MRPVIQEDTTGCGLACVAMLAGVSYRHVKAMAGQRGIKVEDPRLWSDTRYIRELLAGYNISVSRQVSTFTSWNRLPPLALLATKWHRCNHNVFWHWAIFCRGLERSVVIDPKAALKNNIRTDFGRIKPKWFIKINA